MPDLKISQLTEDTSLSEDDEVPTLEGGTVNKRAKLKRILHLLYKIVAGVDGTTITFDLATGNVHNVTLGGNRTLALSNPTVGQKFILRLVQDGTGSRTVTWFTTIKWAGGSPPTLTTTAAKADVFGFLITASGQYDGFVIGQNL